MLYISEQVSNHFIGASLNTTCGNLSVKCEPGGWGVGGGLLSITETESDMSRYKGGLRLAPQ